MARGRSADSAGKDGDKGDQKDEKPVSLRQKMDERQGNAGYHLRDGLGREGELIFRYIYEQAGCRKPVRRLWISSMTDEAIRAGFDSLRPSADYDALYASARCRADADWLIGMNATRAYTIRYNVLLSIGRVQTPTLSMLVKRRREIDAFVPKSFYTVRADFGDYQGVYIDKKGERKLENEEAAQQIAQRVSGRSARVTQAAREHKSVWPPLLYDLTTLQREANAQLGFTAKRRWRRRKSSTSSTSC